MSIKRLVFNKSECIKSGFFSAAFSAAILIGNRVYKEEPINLKDPWLWLFIIILSYAITLIMNVLSWSIPKGLNNLQSWEEKKPFFKKVRTYKAFFPLCWLFIFLLMLPVFCNTFPGILAWDFSTQTHTFMKDAYWFYQDVIQLNGMENVYKEGEVIYYNFHPVLHTFFIRCCLYVGNHLFHSNQAGVAVYSISQMLLLSFSFAALVNILKKNNVPILICAVVAIFSGVWPVNQLFAVAIVKDTPYTAFFVLFICELTKIISAPAAYLEKRLNYIKFPFIIFFFCAFRNNGIHIYAFSAAVAAIIWAFSRKPNASEEKEKTSYFRRLRLPLLIALPFLLWGIYTGIVFPALNVIPSPSQEALSLPIQQMSRTFLLHEPEMTTEEVQGLEQFIPAFRAYDPTCADPPKGVFDNKWYWNHKKEFFSMWIKYGLKYPYEYLYAFLVNTWGYWYPHEVSGEYMLYLDWNVYLEGFHMPIEVNRHALLGTDVLNGYYYRVAYMPETYQNIFGVGFFFESGYTFYYLLFALRLLCYKERKRYFYIMLPLIGAFGILMLSPLASMRYAWPIWVILPVTIVGVMHKKEGESV